MAWLIGTRLGRWVAGAFSALVILLGVYQFGRKAQRDDTRVKNLEDYVDTKKEIEDVEVSSDRDSAVKRLRDNDWVR